MPAWGVGVLIAEDVDYITVEFEAVGPKKLTKAIINTTLLIKGETTESVVAPINQEETKPNNHADKNLNATLVQFDGEENSIAGKNVIEALFDGEDCVIFNETYIILGECTKAVKIHAMYDLTIMGDLIVHECIVNGSLTIIGDAHITNLTCHNDFICKGSLYSDKIYVGGDMNVESIASDELICDGNVVLKTTANINKRAKIERTIVACEGIMGAGSFSARNAIANEYFEFDGDYDGRIFELETDSLIHEAPTTSPQTYETIEEIIERANKKIEEEYNNSTNMDEDEIKEYLDKLSTIQSKELKSLPIVGWLFDRLTELSYKDHIETVDEYLITIIAKYMLPDEIYGYESIEHIDKIFLPKAKGAIFDLTFEPSSLKQFSRTLSMAMKIEEIYEDIDILLDKIFESIGIKYSTVNSMINRNVYERPVLNNQVESESVDKDSIVEIQEEQKKPHIKKSDFLAKKLSHTGKKFGLTDIELERLSSIQIRYIGDFIQTDDSDLVKACGKKAFLVGHLIRVKNLMIEKMEDME